MSSKDEDRMAVIRSIEDELMTYARSLIDGGTSFVNIMVALNSASRHVAREHAPSSASFRRILRRVIEGEIEILDHEMKLASDFEYRLNKKFFELLEERGFGYGNA